MPDRKLILTALVTACIIGAGWVAGEQLPDNTARIAVYLCAGLFALAVIRTSLVVPLLVVHRWRKYAKRNGDVVTTGLHGEPRMVGDRDGLRFLLAQSTELLGGGGGYYARTVVTAAVEKGVPDGLRMYRRDAREWMHHLSGLRAVETGDPELDAVFMIEGADPEATAAWVRAHQAVFEELRERYPRFIAYGSEVDGLPVAAGGASGAVTVLMVGRLSRASELDELVTSVTDIARQLG